MDAKEQIQAAIAAHGQWKIKFTDFMNGNLDLDQSMVQQNNQCAFGKWLESEGKDALPHERLTEIHTLHTDFHKAAGEVVRLKKTGDTTAAEKALSLTGSFTKASYALTRKMNDLTV